mmetsp:Transcript_37589/g.62243  ORF Transcript_37589/g.62243 Transcript_37589/m.62243 type:complete len:158 (+) Transcript_37589:39-512(+)
MPCLYAGFICNYTACTGCSEDDGCILGCKCDEECLCCGREGCLIAGGESHGCLSCKEKKPGECCRFACIPCSECWCRSPETLCKGYSQMCCIYSVESCPFDEEYVNNCVCAYPFCYCLPLACAPKCGCFVEPPYCAKMDMPKNSKPQGAPEGADMHR